MRLKELRKESGKTQLEIANYLNINQSNYGKYELGKIEPNLEILYKLANLYKVSLDYLVGRDFVDDLSYVPAQDKSALKVYLSLTDTNKIKAASFMAGLLATQN